MLSGPAACQAVGILWLTGSFRRPSSGLQKPPTPYPIAVHRHPCSWFPTPKPALGMQVLLDPWRQYTWNISSFQGEPMWVKTPPLNRLLCRNSTATSPHILWECHHAQHTPLTSGPEFSGVKPKEVKPTDPFSSGVPAALYL